MSRTEERDLKAPLIFHSIREKTLNKFLREGSTTKIKGQKWEIPLLSLHHTLPPDMHLMKCSHVAVWLKVGVTAALWPNVIGGLHNRLYFFQKSDHKWDVLTKKRTKKAFSSMHLFYTHTHTHIRMHAHTHIYIYYLALQETAHSNNNTAFLANT